MAEQHTHISYSAEDIERYLTGKMSAKEMHNMEKAALQDPFLADAIEGYSVAPFEQSKKQLNEITAALETQKEETKVVPLAKRNFYWWRVAAIIILVIGVGILSWFIIDSNKGVNEVRDLARAKENKTAAGDTVHQKESSNAIVKIDTSKKLLAQNLAAKARKKQSQKKDLQQHDTTSANGYKLSHVQTEAFKKPVSDSAIMKEDVAVNISPLAERKVDSVQLENQESLAFAQNKFLPLTNELNTFNGRVVDDSNHAVPYAMVRANDKVVTTDTNGYFKLQSPDSSLHVHISSAGFVPASAQLKSHITNNISIRPNSTALNDVFVTKLGAKKKQPGKVFNADSAYPSGGWESFQAYVYKKLNKPFDSTQSPEITGDVQLEFSIDENGEPYNFSVLTSSNNASASKAIEIIKNGPKWISTSKEKKGKITIQF